MPKPIPVFEFAFAAYAATARMGDERPVMEPERGSFEATWRSMASDTGALRVKVGLLDNGRAAAIAPASCESMLPVNEIWLGKLKQTADGYSGVVCMTQNPLRSIGLGQRIDFGLTQIVDWKVSHGSLPRCAALRQRSRSALAGCEACRECALAEEALG